MTDKPGLVAFYDIRPGNGADLFLQPRYPHGAETIKNNTSNLFRKLSRDNSHKEIEGTENWKTTNFYLM